jgi:hypothetical protein
MASAINEIADKYVYRIALGPLWRGVRQTPRYPATYARQWPIEAGLARQI